VSFKTVIFASLAITFAQTAFTQGTVTFVNRGGSTTTSAPGQVYAPIYREDPNDPTRRISGNTPSSVPAGNVSYNGAAFVAAGQQDHTWTATLWGRLVTEVSGDAANNNLLLALNGTTTFGTSTSGISAGIVNRVDSTVAGVRGASFDQATFQVRVWDTRNGTISTWDELMLPQNESVLRGYSDLFTVPYALGDPTLPSSPPFLQGLQSFNLFIVPEPSAVALLIIAAACVICFRGRR
jgi:hypothetical protein